ncbi:MAG: leucyl aminopeptidase [Gammaproteobacteria bacterium]|nr:leucyl aminopeptidase [Gammaproteobacteria bacterium]
MDYSCKISPADKIKTACLVVGVFQKNRMPPLTTQVDQATDGQIRKFLRRHDFSADSGQTQMLYDLKGCSANRVLLVGLGDEKEFNARQFGRALQPALQALNGTHAGECAIVLPNAEQDKDTYRLVREAVNAAETAVYRFDQCKSTAKPPKKPLKDIAFVVHSRAHVNAAKLATSHGHAIGTGSRLAKDLANLPGNICTPSYLAEQAQTLGRGNRKLKVSVLSEAQMEKLGMGSLLSVSRGSRQPAKLIVLEYKGGKSGSKPVVLVGKGLTFDAGGISIKPAANMDEMKYDMCGGASVLGAIAACAELDLPLNVVGVVPSSENLPDGDANKPGDIVTSMSGQTIEILNTDAEGRLILCDALTYSERFEPAAVIDIATLTGACIVALGDQASGLLANDDALAAELLAAGTDCNDRAWQLPLWEDYQQQLDSNFADMANIGGRGAGTITAACFLSRFTKKYKWAHLDIAGTAWLNGAKKGATGRPVPLLTEFLLRRAKVTP